MWVYYVLDDVCSDMSVYHRISDIRLLDAPTFFSLARRLPAYNGAVCIALKNLQEYVQSERNQALKDQRYLDPASGKPAPKHEVSKPTEEARAMTADELQQAGPPAPEIGQYVGLFDVVKCT
jgi:hypothetical protein